MTATDTWLAVRNGAQQLKNRMVARRIELENDQGRGTLLVNVLADGLENDHALFAAAIADTDVQGHAQIDHSGVALNALLGAVNTAIRAIQAESRSVVPEADLRGVKVPAYVQRNVSTGAIEDIPYTLAETATLRTRISELETALTALPFVR